MESLENTLTLEPLVISGEVHEMKDLRGLPYYGIEIPSGTLVSELALLQSKLGDVAYTEAVQAKAARDGEGVYHTTIITPPEMRKFNLEVGSAEESFWEWRTHAIASFMQSTDLNKNIDLRLRGLGRLTGKDAEEGKEAYYVIVESDEVVRLRNALDAYLEKETATYNQEHGTHFLHEPLRPINLHVTLGFRIGDVFASGPKNLQTRWV